MPSGFIIGFDIQVPWHMVAYLSIAAASCNTKGSANSTGTRVSKSCDRATVRLRKNVQELRKIWIFKPKNA